MFPARRVHLLLGAALAAMALGGCNVIGVVADKTMPPPRHPADYTLRPVPTLARVAADPAVSGEAGALDAEPVAIALERALQRHTKATMVSDPARARQVIVVDLAPPSNSRIAGSDINEGSVSGRVRVLDETGRELFPADGSAGRPIQAAMPRVRTSRPDELRRATLSALGEAAAALFYPQVIGDE